MNTPQHKGFVHTAGGRLVYDTGRVCIGLRAGIQAHAPRQLSSQPALHRQSADADWLQAGLLQRKPKPAPKRAPPELTPTTRLGRLWARLKAWAGR